MGASFLCVAGDADALLRKADACKWSHVVHAEGAEDVEGAAGWGTVQAKCDLHGMLFFGGGVGMLCVLGRIIPLSKLKVQKRLQIGKSIHG